MQVHFRCTLGSPAQNNTTYCIFIVVNTYISELDQAQLTELTDAVVLRAGLQEQLGQAHLFAPKHHLETWRLSPIVSRRNKTQITMRAASRNSAALRQLARGLIMNWDYPHAAAPLAGPSCYPFQKSGGLLKGQKGPKTKTNASLMRRDGLHPRYLSTPVT